MTVVQSAQKVALYVRVSGEEQKQGHNIDSQIAELEQFASRQGWTIVDIYKDEAWSGAALARPALDRMRDDAGKKVFDAVLINDVDRLARDVTHLGVIKRGLERAGIKVIFRKIPSENSPTHNLLVNILGSFAEFERELIMDRTRRGRRHKVETRQEFIGCIPSYGYRYIAGKKPDRGGSLVVHADEATVVREMYRWVDEDGMTIRAVALRLSREGIRPRKGGDCWRTSSVRGILRNSIYCGTWHYNKHQVGYPRWVSSEATSRAKKSSARLRPKEEWIPVALPANLRIVTPEQWQRVQARVDSNRAFSPRNARHVYLLSGLVQCAGCGSRFVGNPSHGHFQYRCMKRCKRLPLVGESVLDTSVWSSIERALIDPNVFSKAIVETKQKPPISDGEVAQIDLVLAGLTSEEARVLEAYRLNILTPAQLARELEGIASRRQFLEKRQKELNERFEPALPIRPSLEEFCQQIRKRIINLTFETKRSILRLLLTKIVYEGDQVRIFGLIPLADQGGIANTEIYHRGPNPTATFSFTVPINRKTEEALAASRANLVKASAARWPRRAA